MLFTTNKVPIEFFFTSGSGESLYGGKGLPYEAGAYDAALTEAGIENYNIVKYTSVLPTHAKEVSIKKGKESLSWGSVLDSILAQTNGKKGQILVAALLIAKIYDPNDNYLGGFACEYSERCKGCMPQKQHYTHKNLKRGSLKHLKKESLAAKTAKEILFMDVTEMMERRGYGKPINAANGRVLTNTEILKKASYIVDEKIGIRTNKGYVYQPYHCKVKVLKPKSTYGTAISAMCFTKFAWGTIQ